MKAFLDREDDLAATKGVTIEAIEAQAAQGLSDLAQYGTLHFQAENMSAAIPRTRTAPSAELLAASFVLTEFVNLRRRVNASGIDRIKELEKRLAALEKKLGNGREDPYYNWVDYLDAERRSGGGLSPAQPDAAMAAYRGGRRVPPRA